MNPEENELILKTIEGDHAAFSRLVQMHDARVMGITRSILGPGFDAEEVYQDIFLKVHRSIGSFRFESEFTTWLHRIAVNVAISKKRSLTRRNLKERIVDDRDDFFDNAPGNPWDNPENLQLRQEILKQLEAALEQLPARQRTVFVMKHDHGMKLKEIARTLQIGEGTVKAYLFRAIEKLRVILEPYYRIEG